MESIDVKMRDLLLKTPERRSKNASILSTPGLPPMSSTESKLTTAAYNDTITTTPGQELSNFSSYPYSPQASTYPIVVPHRIFVGGFPPETTEHELRCYFERFGIVRDVKIIRDEPMSENTAAPKYTYGFVTFGSEEEAQKIVEMNKCERGRAFKFQGRYLNVNEAVKKPPNKYMNSVNLGPVVCRDQNGQFMTLVPSYTVVHNQEYLTPQPQCMAPMVPIMMPPSVYQVPPQTPTMPPMTQMAYSQYSTTTAVPTSIANPQAGYYQQHHQMQ